VVFTTRNSLILNTQIQSIIWLNNHWNNKEITSKQHRKSTSIAKTDPRNDYARIIEDAINCADPESSSNTFRYLLDPQCRTEKRVRLQRKGTNNPQYSADQYMTMYADDATEIVESSVTGIIL